MSLTPCVKYTISSSLVPKRLTAANQEVLINDALDVAVAMANLFCYIMPKSLQHTVCIDRTKCFFPTYYERIAGADCDGKKKFFSTYHIEGHGSLLLCAATMRRNFLDMQMCS